MPPIWNSAAGTSSGLRVIIAKDLIAIITVELHVIIPGDLTTACSSALEREKLSRGFSPRKAIYFMTSLDVTGLVTCLQENSSESMRLSSTNR